MVNSLLVFEYDAHEDVMVVRYSAVGHIFPLTVVRRCCSLRRFRLWPDWSRLWSCFGFCSTSSILALSFVLGLRNE